MAVRNDALQRQQARSSRPTTRESQRSRYSRRPSSSVEGLQGLWWVYRPTKQMQANSMVQLSQPKKRMAPVKKEGKAGCQEGPKTSLDWVIMRAKTTPGPGQYQPNLPSRIKYVGRFNESHPKGELDWIETKAKESPGPGTYLLGAEYKVPGGRFSRGQSKTSIDWVQYRAKTIPGPSDYDTRTASAGVSGGKWSTSYAKSSLDWVVYEAKSKPGPGQYSLQRSVSSIPGGRFSGSGGKTALDWQIHRSKSLPAPWDYTLKGIGDDNKRGMKFSIANPKTDVDWLIYHSARTPGPGQYEVGSLFGDAFGGTNNAKRRPGSENSSSRSSTTTSSSSSSRRVKERKVGRNIEELGDVVDDGEGKDETVRQAVAQLLLGDGAGVATSW